MFKKRYNGSDLYQDLSNNKYTEEACKLNIYDFSKLPIIKCNYENTTKNFEEFINKNSELQIFVKINLEEEFSSIKNYKKTCLSNLITNEELANFMKKYMYEIYNGKFSNLIIQEKNREYTFKEEGEKIKVEHIKLI